MKIRKIGFLIISVAIMISSIQVNPIQAQEFTPTFGLEIVNHATVEKVDGGVGEPNNYWVHKNGLLWSAVQKDRATSNWDVPHVRNLDAYLKTMHEAGMEVILTIRSTPTWAQKYPGYFCGPMGEIYIDEFADFVNETVTRYSQAPFNVRYYEIWNEPDDIRSENYENNPYGCWGEPDDEQGFGGSYYGQMLKQVYPALKAASPDAQLVIGGLLLPADPEADYWNTWEIPPQNWVYANMSKFFKGILKTEKNGTGDWPYFDFVNFHGYTNYTPNSNIIELERLEGTPPQWEDRGGVIAGKLDYLRELMSKYSVNKPFIVTEAALRGTIVPDYDPVFEASKADYVVWLYTRNMAKGIYATTWYHLDNYGWGRSGMLDRNNNPLPAYHAYTVLTELLDGAVYQRDVNAGEGVLGFEFGNGTRYWVLFSEDGSEKTIPKPALFSAAYDIFGEEITTSIDYISIERPIYVEFENSAPVANDDLYILNNGAEIKVPAPGVLSNDTDIDGKNNLQAIIETDPFGNLTLKPDGSFIYTPDQPFEGPDSFTYRVSDGESKSNIATVTIIDGTWLFLPLVHR